MSMTYSWDHVRRAPVWGKILEALEFASFGNVNGLIREIQRDLLSHIVNRVEAEIGYARLLEDGTTPSKAYQLATSRIKKDLEELYQKL